ncbi:MAG: pyrroline-5-carboxylate reductase family protein, partial [Sulfurifustaceae bacterium]
MGFIGAGNMARSLAGGLIANGWPAARIVLSDPDASQRKAVEESLRVKTYPQNADVVARAQILVLAVKPQIMHAVATEIALAVRETRPLILSIAAGIRLPDLQRWLGAEIPLVRAMPNTAALVSAGASALCANALANER